VGIHVYGLVPHVLGDALVDQGQEKVHWFLFSSLGQLGQLPFLFHWNSVRRKH